MMTSFFHTITEENKLTLNKPSDSDVVYYSELNEWFTANAFRNFSLKYVVDRCIYYKVGNREHVVNQGNFLLACRQPDVKAYFDSTAKVRSVCIDICPATVAEAFTVLTAQDDHDFDNYLDSYFKVPQFLETVCPVNAALFGDKLKDLVHVISTGEANRHFDKEWFLDLVEKIIFHEYGNYLALNGIRSVRLETRKEILRRLRVARQYMDDELQQIDEIGEIAQVCNMSEFHFYRSFKQAFGISPYQYLLKKRLDLAMTLIHSGTMSFTSIATHCNFPDVFTFSKAFKRKFHMAPSHYARRNDHE
ncbi:MAG: helix-turn-helix transcriptional regulator [Chitinophagaceae bacterium]|nr:helix-turn-helix transcriptional regulator [Chitinophagaceae bacterium]